MFQISKEFTFSASHQLEGLPANHPCMRLHGHNYTVTLVLESPTLDARGFVEDYRALDKFKHWLDEQIDHRHLNELFPCTTAESLAKAIYETWAPLGENINAGPGAYVMHLVEVRVSETPKTCAVYRP